MSGVAGNEPGVCECFAPTCDVPRAGGCAKGVACETPQAN